MESELGGHVGGNTWTREREEHWQSVVRALPRDERKDVAAGLLLLATRLGSELDLTAERMVKQLTAFVADIVLGLWAVPAMVERGRVAAAHSIE